MRKRMYSRILTHVLVGLVLLLLSSYGIQRNTVRADDVTITFVCCSYIPSSVFITVGDTVTWQGDFSAHPLVSDDALWTTPSTGNTFNHTFLQAGTYRFHCAIHGGLGGVGMSGQVHVLGAQKVFLPIIIR